ncbi:MAG: hypothetical protein WAQ98_27470 [Blastocatellia bacterium]
MPKVEEMIKDISLPIPLPEGAFILFGKQRRIPDFDLIIKQLPLEVREQLDPNATASSGGTGAYLLPLVEGNFLKMRVENYQIVELAVVEH